MFESSKKQHWISMLKVSCRKLHYSHPIACNVLGGTLGIQSCFREGILINSCHRSCISQLVYDCIDTNRWALHIQVYFLKSEYSVNTRHQLLWPIYKNHTGSPYMHFCFLVANIIKLSFAFYLQSVCHVAKTTCLCVHNILLYNCKLRCTSIAGSLLIRNNRYIIYQCQGKNVPQNPKTLPP